MSLLYHLRGLFVYFLKFKAFIRDWYFILKQNFKNKRLF
ncbi:hypothetical protein HPOKI673_04735 [Helicobacter pylori oki673]|nr:hypothetical protein HPOKI154_03605 [Helicobacter pylori oki154]AHN41929.1 hypothetical protein HPOKI673_03585 [Helicobacter pylori oki673]AHN43370.1 hypothetical protein HPOKI828_03600 [Helicobacter pylori oki828]AHN39229.1 hypothetical protein HPOKI154_04750 [Helicobacter pylori oki154]AHN42131.1 hypothetical protein HPOKI673_04735 [Helicobacter pylori oki673]